MEIKKLVMSGSKITAVAEAFPVKELDNHLIVVRMGYNGYDPSDEEFDEYFDDICDSDALDELDNASFLLVSHDVNIEKYRPTDFKPLKPLSWRHRFKRVWFALKGY